MTRALRDSMSIALLGATCMAALHAQARSFIVTLESPVHGTVHLTQMGGAGHAFFDWKPNPANKATFAKYGVFHAAQMKAFFESVLY